MTPYSRGYAAGLKAAAEVCKSYADELAIGASAAAATICEHRILSLPILGEATNPGEQELPAAAAKALPSVSQMEQAGRDATEGASAQQPASPGPCVVVPEEPTEAMLRAGVCSMEGDAVYKVVSKSGTDRSEAELREAYKAMLAAAKEE